ncbi:hypothetical protein A3H09_02725 [Candidatus Falkowbacteria bacterium RIFCSPLOWO2_12_FULL_45_13]|uniref:PDZ domain-containing protein n=2 Tax=Candidatus Falkowiibacteriota TaxID=1752728 RepID=A0A1F5SC59_9BACT|nr:MAG: hypothetical protein A3H66_02085 [Candidatus Falkowbacteria bacterium RIFCSPLOWO2_02_FULL_45_21]OGF29863.1 MAG: hypothetical protein A3H09_02725 [Candidatus Falkowbacteria bacterium RIFCSPLOWO2_12_FULL_45_13]
MRRVKDFFKKHNLIVLIIISLIFGLGGGLVGEITAQAYLADSWYGFSSFGNLDFSNGQYGDQGLVISNPKNVIVQQDAKVDETINSVSSSLVGIYKKQKPVKSNQLFILDNFYKINEPSGQGFIITSDGWIVTSQALDKSYNDYAVITKDKKIYQIDKAVVDNLTKFNFIHVQARDLPVRKFAEDQRVKSGQLAVAVNWLGSSLVSAVAGFSRTGGLVKSSDSFSEKLLLNDKLPPEFQGSIIFNLAGEALGLADDRGEIEPINHFGGAVKSLFKNKTSARIYLGINYIVLDELAEVDGQNSRWQKGVIIHRSSKAPAVRKDSPADKAGLREGDVIISVDDVFLNKDNDLADVIQDREAGEVIDLVVLRNDLEREVRLRLEAIK